MTNDEFWDAAVIEFAGRLAARDDKIGVPTGESNALSSSSFRYGWAERSRTPKECAERAADLADAVLFERKRRQR